MRYPFSVIVIGVAQNQPIPIRKGYIFCAPHETREEGVQDIGDNHRKDVGLVLAQSLRQLAGRVARFVDRIEDALAQAFAL